MSIACLLAPALASALAPPAEPPPAAEGTELEHASRPRLGMQVRSVEVDTGPETYRLTARSWGDVVADDPELKKASAQAELFVPGVVFASLGGLWLTTTTAWTIDEHAQGQRRRDWGDADLKPLTASQITWRFGVPAALVIGGVTAAIVGGRARRRLEAAERRFYLGAQANRTGGGVTLGGRF